MTSLIISNLPLDCKIYDVNKECLSIGEIKRSHLLKSNKGEFLRQAQVKFTNIADCDAALTKLNNISIKGSVISVHKPEASESTHFPDIKQINLDKKLGSKNKSIKVIQLEDGKENSESNLPSKKDKSKRKNSEADDSNNKAKKKIKLDTSGEGGEETTPKINNDNRRIVIRNVPDVMEYEVEKHFSEYGTIKNISDPKSNKYKKNKKCFFIEFETRQGAKKALDNADGSTLEGQIISVGPAIPKDKFQGKKKPDEGDDAENIPPKRVDYAVIIRNLPFKATKEKVREMFGYKFKVSKILFPAAGSGCCFVHFKKEEEIEKSIDAFNLTEFMGRTVVVQKALNKDVFMKPDDDGLERSVAVKKERLAPEEFSHSETSKDVEEGRTLFITGLSLDTDEISIQGMLNQFGEVQMVKKVMNKETDQFSGKAFAQFATKEEAEACLACASDPGREDELKLNMRVPVIKRALGRGNVPEQGVKPKIKDKRNLYLAREGFIRPGTGAAQGVSAKDLMLRRMRVTAKEKLLKNLHNYVSTTRLCVNNLPQEIGDNDLLKIFEDHNPPGANITESRVMRRTEKVDLKGQAVSRGFGFVDYSKHEHALVALRSVNNNPNIFGPSQRPVVEFSIENMNANKTKAKRKLKSKSMKNGKGKVPAKNPEDVVARDIGREKFSGHTAKKGEGTHGGSIHRHTGAKMRKKHAGIRGKKRNASSSRTRVKPTYKKKVPTQKKK